MLGVAEAAERCFRLPNSELLRVREMMLILIFLDLLKTTAGEAAKHERRFEIGPVIGADKRRRWGRHQLAGERPQPGRAGHADRQGAPTRASPPAGRCWRPRPSSARPGHR